MTRHHGLFVVSLDVELYWGMRDKLSLDDYRARLLGGRSVIPRLLDLFEEYGIHATWATIGFLFFETRDELLASLPARLPAYTDGRLSPYPHLRRIGDGERADPYHYALSLIRQVAARPFQEIGSHTFSHYYCLEEGQDLAAFADDLRAALRAASRLGLRLESIVFPRNQINPAYLATCKRLGIIAYRGNPPSWPYRARPDGDETLARRAVRLADNYINLTSHNAHRLLRADLAEPVNVPASRFLRPYTPGLRLLEPLRLRRLRDELTFAARSDMLYHLWWHPHNFGSDQAENLAILRGLLDHFARLRDEHGMQSLTMGEVARLVAEESPVGSVGCE